MSSVRQPTEIDGVVNLNKPIGITSAKALYAFRKITGIRKSGHSGTLDPAAAGVLVLCLGRGTKLVERLMDQPKRYRASARLDVTSSSFDSDRPLVSVAVGAIPSLEQLRRACARLTGCILQVPPAVSAIKVGGRAAYKIERQGGEIQLAPRPVQVYSFDVTRYAWPELDFEVCCGRGTYVRALIRDLGAALSCGGCLTRLTRTAVGPFNIEESRTLEAVSALTLRDALITMEAAQTMLARVPAV